MPADNQEIINTIIAGTAVIILFGCCIIVFAFAYQRRHNKYLSEKQQLQSQFQQTLLQSQLEIQEQTLHKISQEIHDNIGQILSLVKLNINTMDAGQPDTLQQKILDSRDLVSKAIRDLRELSRSLNTSYITEMGLLRSIEYEAEMIRKSGVFELALEVTGSPAKLDPQKELILFRIFQEIINNIIKHAGAARVVVGVSYQAESFALTVTDNGKGFDVTLLDISKNPNFGLGLRNMHNRARLMGAAFEITSIPGKGSTVNILLPINT